MVFKTKLEYEYQPEKFAGYKDDNKWVYDRIIRFYQVTRYAIFDVVEKFQVNYKVEDINYIRYDERVIRTYQVGYENPMSDKFQDRSIYLAFRQMDTEDYNVIMESLRCIFYEYVFRKYHDEIKEFFPVWVTLQDQYIE